MKYLLFLSILIVSGCILAGDPVKEGDMVSIDYIGRLEDGTLMDTSLEDVARAEGKFDPEKKYEPLETVVGSGKLIKGFELALVGMKEGEEKEVTILPEDAYGHYDPGMLGAIPIENILKHNITPEAGGVLFVNEVPYEIVEVNSTHVTVDSNHELAGETLLFSIRLVDIITRG